MANYELDSETGMTDEDKDVIDTVDNIIAVLQEEIGKDDGKVSIVVPSQMRKFSDVYKAVKRITNGMKGVKVSCEVNEPFTSMGSISVVGKDIVFNNPELFMQSVRSADNFEVYPKIDGTVQMNFTFHGLTTVVTAKNK